jgi:hypothetical protein
MVTRAQIRGYLEAFVDHLVKTHRTRTIPSFQSSSDYLQKHSTKAQLKPFHAAMIPPELLRMTEFERSFSTALGTTFEESAMLLARAYHGEAERGYDLASHASLTAINEIDHQVVTFEHAAEKGVPRPRLDAMIDAVLSARRPGDLEPRSTRADLYVRTRDGRRLFFELKSPRPNKGQCVEVTQRILRMHLLCGAARPAVQAYFALPYNPYGPSRADYTWSFARNYTPFDEAVLIGAEFWDMIGGPGAYEALLDLYREVGHDKSKYIIDALAFGF